MANLTKLRVAALRKKAEKAGVEGYEDMKRSELVDALNNPKEEEKGKEKEGDELVPPGEEKASFDVGSEAGISENEGPSGSKSRAMKEFLSKQPKVLVSIHLESGEPIGATQSVNLNGYRLNIKKGVTVSVPKQVAEVLQEARHATLLAVEENPQKLKGTERELQ